MSPRIDRCRYNRNEMKTRSFLDWSAVFKKSNVQPIRHLKGPLSVKKIPRSASIKEKKKRKEILAQSALKENQVSLVSDVSLQWATKHKIERLRKTKRCFQNIQIPIDRKTIVLSERPNKCNFSKCSSNLKKPLITSVLKIRCVI